MGEEEAEGIEEEGMGEEEAVGEEIEEEGMGEEEAVDGTGDDNIPMTVLMLIDNFSLQKYINNQFYKNIG